MTTTQPSLTTTTGSPSRRIARLRRSPTVSNRPAVSLGSGLGAILLAVTCSSCTYYRLQLRGQKLNRADVIIVPGIRLTWSGQGSTVLWNRMRMAKLLLDRGYGDRLIVTGGQARAGVTESSKMVEYGLCLGIPAALLVPEPNAKTSVDNGRFSADIMVRDGLHSALVVSDWWHLAYAIPVFRDAFEARHLKLYWTPVDTSALQEHGAPEPPDLMRPSHPCNRPELAPGAGMQSWRGSAHAQSAARSSTPRVLGRALGGHREASR